MRLPKFLHGLATWMASLGTGVWLACGLLAAGIFIVVAALALLTAASDARRQADEAASNIAAIVERDVVRNVEQFDLALQTAIDGLQVPGIEGLSPQLRNLVLFNRAASIKYLGFINILDENGDVIAEPQPAPHATNWSGRDYFAAHHGDASPGIYISRPFAIAQEDLASIALSRRISHPDGTFAGVAVAAMRLAYVRDLFNRLALGSHGSVTLWRTDGVLLMRLPFDRNDIGRTLVSDASFLAVLHAGTSGELVADPVDQLTRRFVVRQIGALPLLVSVGLSVDDFQHGQNRLIAQLGVGALLLMLSLALIAALRREASRRSSVVRDSSNRMRYLAATSHDLRTPLHSVLGNAEQLATALHLDPADAGHVTAILKGGAELRTVIDRTLDYLQLETRAPNPKMASVDLQQLLDDCRTVFEPGASARGLALRCLMLPRTPRWFITDLAMLRQILQNLVGNAVKYTIKGKVDVTVDGTAELVRVEVADTGPGIPANQRDRLFVEFERLGAENTGIAGNGLGLSICRRLVKSLGGKIGHRDNPGGGSVFWFTMPAGTLLDVAGRLDRQAAPAADRPLRVLLVDDVEMNRELAGEMLRGSGHIVTEAISGIEALRLARADDFDVVLMDMRMPGMDGLEATKRIRAIEGSRGHVPIVAVTANASDEHAVQCRDAGMTGHLAKPFSKEELLAAVARAVTERPSDQSADIPAFDTEALEQLAHFMSEELIEQHLRELTRRIEAVLRRLDGQDTMAKDPMLAEMTHEVAGSAGTYGFAALSAAAHRYHVAAIAQPGSPQEKPAFAQVLVQEARAALSKLRELTLPEPVDSTC
jgi:signal transduction histidine kinase/DNA-binding NarL/FixJ family response regulator